MSVEDLTTIDEAMNAIKEEIVNDLADSISSHHSNNESKAELPE